MKWRTLINKTNASTFKWPEGWDTRERVAEQLECSPDRVREVLAPAIRAGAVEVRDFKVWEDGRFVRKTGFRAVDTSKPKTTTKASKEEERPELSVGLRVVSRRASGRGVVTKVGGAKFMVDWGKKQTSYAMTAWKKRDILPA